MNVELLTSRKPAQIILAFLFIGLGWFFWWYGAKESVLFSSGVAEQENYTKQILETRAPDFEHEKKLAEAYWQRYPDVRKDPLRGEHGIMGIRGPRDHYNNFGKKEGRIWHILPEQKNTAEELKLAEAYWARYPDVAQSRVWGRKGALGISGPRDHFQLLGQKEGRTWGHGNNLNEQE